MAYGTVAGWRVYALALGDSAPTSASDASAAAALERASRYIRLRYVSRMASDVDTTDARIVEATYIAASLELARVGFFAASYTPAQAKVLIEVKGIRWEARDSGITGNDAMVPVSADIEMLLAPLGYNGTAVMVV